MKKAYITRALLKEYLTIKEVDITFDKDINIIIGKNGVGKTNFVNILADSLLYKPNIQFNGSVVDYVVGNNVVKKMIFNSLEINEDFGLNEIQRVEYYRDGEGVVKQSLQLALSASKIEHGVPENYRIAKEPIFDILKKSEEGYYVFPNFKDNIIGFRIGFDYMVNVMSKGLVLESDYNVNQSLISLNENLSKYSNIEKVAVGENFKLNVVNEEEVHFNNLYLEYLVNGEWLLFNQLSDGTKRLFYIISEISLTNKSVILLEEPELGLHPHQLYKLMDFIKEKSSDLQFIITTHSPLVLNMLNKDELGSVIIAKFEDAQTKLVHLTEEQKEKAKVYMEDLDLSDYWVHSDLED